MSSSSEVIVGKLLVDEQNTNLVGVFIQVLSMLFLLPLGQH